MSLVHGLRGFAAACCALLLLVPAYGQAAGRPPAEPSLTGTFSDICLHAESGDLIGTELSFIPLSNGTIILFQRADGWLLKPVLISPKTISTRRVEVQAGESGGVAFTAELNAADELVLELKNGDRDPRGSSSAVLHRRLATWSGQQRLPACK